MPNQAYEATKSRAAERAREQSEHGREIGPLPEVVDPERKLRGFESLEAFGLEYFPNRFFLAPSSAHREAINRMEVCTADGGFFCFALMRGGGKSAWAEVAAMRAIMYGLRRFAALIQATKKLADNALKKIQGELESNDRLLEDFPEVCYPIRRLERIHNRAKGQTLNGEPTRIEWKQGGLVLPTVRGAASSGAIIHVAGLTGAIRGLSVRGPDGVIVRPDLLVIDDAQTRKSALSPTQTDQREQLILADLLGLAGPNTAIAAINLCTPMYVNDLAERFLDVNTRPEWNGVRTSMLQTMPTNMTLWDQYYEETQAGHRDRDGGARSNAFFRKHAEKLQAGAVVTWPERKKPNHVDALQTAMDLYYQDPESFAAEYQCKPTSGLRGSHTKELHAAEIAKRVNGLERYVVPRGTVMLTAGFDVGIWCAWWSVVAWANKFTGAVIDYGVWPEQARSNFRASDARPLLRDHYKKLTDEQIVYRTLCDMVPPVLSRRYLQEGTGEEFLVSKGLIDRGYMKEAVHKFLRQSSFSNILLGSKGFARSKAQRTGVGGWQLRDGEIPGHNFKITAADTGKGRMLQFDSDEWKTSAFDLLTTPIGGTGTLELWGKRAGLHEMFADHCSAEYGTFETINGVSFYSWLPKPGGPDNHWFDTVILNSIAASWGGLKASIDPAAGDAVPKPKKKVSLKELQAEARKRRQARQTTADGKRIRN